MFSDNFIGALSNRFWSMIGLAATIGIVTGFAVPLASSYQSQKFYQPILPGPVAEICNPGDTDSCAHHTGRHCCAGKSECRHGASCGPKSAFRGACGYAAKEVGSAPPVEKIVVRVIQRLLCGFGVLLIALGSFQVLSFHVFQTVAAEPSRSIHTVD